MVVPQEQVLAVEVLWRNNFILAGQKQSFFCINSLYNQSLMDNDYQQKLSLLGLLVELVNTDGNMTEEESNFINRLGDMYGITPLDMLKLKSEELKPDMVFPETEADRVPFFQTCVMTMGIDKNVTEEEREFCSELGLKMGIRKEVITVVMNLFEKYFPQPVPIEELMMAYNIGRN